MAVNAPANAIGPDPERAGPANPDPPNAKDPMYVVVVPTTHVLTVCGAMRPEPRVPVLSNSINLPFPVASIENA